MSTRENIRLIARTPLNYFHCNVFNLRHDQNCRQQKTCTIFLHTDVNKVIGMVCNRIHMKYQVLIIWFLNEPLKM